MLILCTPEGRFDFAAIYAYARLLQARGLSRQDALAVACRLANEQSTAARRMSDTHYVLEDDEDLFEDEDDSYGPYDWDADDEDELDKMEERNSCANRLAA